MSWTRTSPCTEPRFQEPALSCFLQAFYAKLSQSSTRVWLVILTSVRLPVGTRQNAGASKDERTSVVAHYLLQNKHYENSLVNPTYAGVSCHLHLDSPVYYWHVTSVFHCFFSTTSSHGLMLVRVSTLQCKSDSTLTVTCYSSHTHICTLTHAITYHCTHTHIHAERGMFKICASSTSGEFLHACM